MSIIKPDITSGHVLSVGGLVLSVGSVLNVASFCCMRVLMLYSCFLAPKAPAAPKAPQQIKESRSCAPSALRFDGDSFEF